MPVPAQLEAFLRDNLAQVVVALAITNVLLLVVAVAAYSRIGRLTRHYRRLTRGATGDNLQDVLEDMIVRVEQADERTSSHDQRIRLLEQEQVRSLRHVGFVRYDAFDDVGGGQSFVVAVLDDRRSGFVLSSLYSRTDVRVYAKRLEGGRASHPLTEEEQQAVAMAERD